MRSPTTEIASTTDMNDANAGILYHGGVVMPGMKNIYLIWYGTKWTSAAQQVIIDFISNEGGTPYFNINSLYDDSTGARCDNYITLAGQATVGASLGTTLNDNSIWSIVSGTLTDTTPLPANKLPWDVNGIYFVLTSNEIKESSGFCTQYCGWHTAAQASGRPWIKYAFIGDASVQCRSGCIADQGPNGQLGADGMISVIAHELQEACTDPLLDAWYDASGNENADKCAWTFGTEYLAGTGFANVRMGNRDYLIQQNWIPTDGGYCGLHYP